MFCVTGAADPATGAATSAASAAAKGIFFIVFALPILASKWLRAFAPEYGTSSELRAPTRTRRAVPSAARTARRCPRPARPRSEERRVGKECSNRHSLRDEVEKCQERQLDVRRVEITDEPTMARARQ